MEKYYINCSNIKAVILKITPAQYTLIAKHLISALPMTKFNSRIIDYFFKYRFFFSKCSNSGTIIYVGNFTKVSCLLSINKYKYNYGELLRAKSVPLKFLINKE